METRHKETKLVYCNLKTFLSEVRVKEEYKNFPSDVLSCDVLPTKKCSFSMKSMYRNLVSLCLVSMMTKKENTVFNKDL